MQGVVFYLVYPIIYLVACLPFRLLYGLSDFLYFLLKLTGYRREVVVSNLRNSFPEKRIRRSERWPIHTSDSYAISRWKRSRRLR